MLLTLIAIFLVDGTLRKAFDSQCNNKDIFQSDSRGKPCAKEMLRNNHATFFTIPLKSETNDGPASTIEQLSVPDNGPAITTSSFLQLPNDSLFLLHDEDNSEIMTLSLLLPFNQENSAIMTVTHATSLFLLRDEDNSEIMTPSLLLPFSSGQLSNYDSNTRNKSLSASQQRQLRNYDFKLLVPF